MSMPALLGQMPIAFANGMRVESLSAVCPQCLTPIGAEHCYGEVTRLIPQVAAVEAICFCKSCKQLSDLHVRYHDDKRISVVAAGVWTNIKLVTPWRLRLTQFIKKFLRI